MAGELKWGVNYPALQNQAQPLSNSKWSARQVEKVPSFGRDAHSATLGADQCRNQVSKIPIRTRPWHQIETSERATIKYESWGEGSKESLQSLFPPFPIRHVRRKQPIERLVVTGVHQMTKFMRDDVFDTNRRGFNESNIQ